MYNLWNRTGQWFKSFGSSYFDSATMNIPASTWPTLRIGRTFDATNSSAGIDIYPPNISTKKTNVNRFKFEYRIVKNSSDAKKLLDISGGLPLKVKAGLLKLEGSGRFLEDSIRKEGTTEVLVVLKCITVSETMDGLVKVADEVASGKVREGLGTHVVRGVTYGAEMVASLSIKTSSSAETLNIRGSAEGEIKAGAPDVSLKGQLKRLTSECSDLSDITVNYYATEMPDTLPTSLDELVRVIEQFPSRLEKINNGHGIPLQYELLPINTAIQTTRPPFQHKLSIADEESMEERLDDLLTAKDMLKKYEESREEDSDDAEDAVLDLSEKITKVMGQFKEAIRLMNSEGGKDKIDACLEVYRKALDGRDLVGKFSKNCKKITKSKKPVKPASSIKKPVKPASSIKKPVKPASSIKLPEGNPLKVVLLGKTGNGKSATGNSILGRDAFKEGNDPMAVSNHCQSESRKDEREITVIDTPGIMDYKYSQSLTARKEILEEVAKCFALTHDGAHAICMVMRYGDRFTAEDKVAFLSLQGLLGEEAETHMFLILTFADLAKKDAKQKNVPLDFFVKEWVEKLPAPLVKVFIQNRIETNRVLLFDNALEKDSGDCKMQLRKLIQSIDDALRVTGGPFEHKLSEPSKTERSKRIEKAMADLDKEEDDLKKVKRESEERLKKGGLDEIERKKLEKRLTDVNAELQRISEKKPGIVAQIHRTMDKMIESGTAVNVVSLTVSVLVVAFGKGGCFPESATFVDEHGHRRTMSSIFMGEKIQVITNNKVSTEPVITFIHRQPEVMHEFLEITTLKKKRALKITEDHLLFVEKEGQAAAMPARDVIIGDTVYVRGVHGAVETDAVQSISRVYEKGVYAPVTLSGTILVNDVHTSCYFDVLSHEWSHRAMGVARAVHHVSPWMLQWLSRVGEKDGFPGWCRLAHKMLTWFD